MSILSSASRLVSSSNKLMGRIPVDLVQLALRFGLAGIFWMSARTKVTGFMTVSDTTYYLFQEEYQLPLIPVEIAAPLATYAEHVLPILLAIGLASRLSALGLFIMALVIQVFVYPSAFWSTHLGWFAMALAIMHFGPGRWSIDYLLSNKNKSRTHGE